ncbi:thiamine phosphate synthase [Sphingomonas sp. Mn802worker]|uniref:thiamine phosphate synthase n=1 Tax=Sphingomonas sp. Mn802worker TaxID=629773 RepID=UPI001EE69459|nr:thiamine phosphate synthase [Sphingomonas sp. Mn802worker]
MTRQPRRPRAGMPRLPTRWLMTDERMGKDLWRALLRLPRGGGVVFRHYTLPADERRRLFARIRRITRSRGLMLIRAGTMRMAGEQGVHAQRGGGWVTWPVHSIAEARQARRVGAVAVFVSPVFATRSHPGASTLGARRARLIGAVAGAPPIALGGIDEVHFARLAGFQGYAAIDAWMA